MCGEREKRKSGSMGRDLKEWSDRERERDRDGLKNAGDFQIDFDVNEVDAKA